MRIWPSYFECGPLANEKSRSAVDANVERVRGIGDNLREALFLQVEAFVAAVQGDAQRMGSGGKKTVEVERFTLMAGVQPS